MSNNKKRLNSRAKPTPKSENRKVSADEIINRVLENLQNEKTIVDVKTLIEPYKPPANVLPDESVKHNHALARDSAFVNMQSIIDGYIGYNGVVFKGYLHYAQLYNMPEFRKIIEVMSTEMTRKWIELKSTGDSQVGEKIKGIKKELSRLNVKSRIGELIAHNFIYGRGQLYINLKMPKDTGLVADDNDELKSALLLNNTKIPKGGIVSLNIIDPIQTTAAQMNTTEPLKSDYYEPISWYVAGKEVHKDRIITLITNEVAAFLKPAFNYGGLSLLQLVEPTVNNWLAVRDSGKDLVRGSNIFALKTNMQNIISDGGCDEQDAANAVSSLTTRAKLFSAQRNSQSLMLLDFEDEELTNINVSMAGIAEMVTKYQEQPSQVTGIPVVKLTGNTPSGLNASSEGEIQVFYDMITALKESYIREPIQYIINIIQLSLFGDIDDSITFDFVPMKELTEKEVAEIDAIKTATLRENIESGMIQDIEGREILKRSGNPDYSNLREIEEVDDEEDEDPEDKLN